MLSVSNVSFKLPTFLYIADENTSPTKHGAQRRLDYFSLSNLSTNTESSSAAYHSFKYDSGDVPKRAHIQRYLRQLGLAEKPVKEAWSDSLANSVVKSQSKVERPAKHPSPGNMS